jgi:lipopolysaccharide export system permease protein
MKILHRMIIRSFLQVLCIGELFFVLIILMVDLFANLWRYLQNGAEIFEILESIYLYLPRAAHFALPPALLFAVAFVLGTYQSQRELIAVFASGFSLLRFTFPLLIIAAVLSFGSFLFLESSVIPFSQEKRILTDQLIGRTGGDSNTNIIIRGDRGILYKADYYNSTNDTLTRLSIIIRGDDNITTDRFESKWAEFSPEKGYWILHEARHFSFNTPDIPTESYHKRYEDHLISEPPRSFKKEVRDIDELQLSEARSWLKTLERTGNPQYRKALTKYHERFSFSFTPLIVTMLAISISGYFQKNILLMSLLSSLIISVIYYVLEMVLVLLAGQGMLPPITGAWTSVIIFLFLASFLIKRART